MLTTPTGPELRALSTTLGVAQLVAEVRLDGAAEVDRLERRHRGVLDVDLGAGIVCGGVPKGRERVAVQRAARARGYGRLHSERGPERACAP